MSTVTPTTVEGFSVYAAQQFLQTAVYVDDRIYDRKSGSATGLKPALRPAPKRKAALKSANDSGAVNTPEPLGSHDSDEYSLQDIVTSFAKKQIVCSLYQPDKQASVGQRSDAYQLCVASDIVIVDWDLYGDAGAKALELITHLIEQSLKDVPEQLRLILIYTIEPNLFDVANTIYTKLAERLPDNVAPARDDGGLALDTPNTRVAILGKPGRRPQKYRDYEVPAKTLAERAISEFSKLASGLLQGTVLLGLAEIRRNSRKVLSKFDASLDPAFLTHRALLATSGEDASSHIVPLLIEEIQSILEDCLPKPLISRELIENWIEELWEPRDEVTSAVTGDKKAAAKSFCLEGKLENVSKKDSYTFLLPQPESMANHELAGLLSLRTHYLTSKRRLRLGAVLRDPDCCYHLCLQPVCDCVRLDGMRHFLLLQLHTKDSQEADGKTNLIVFEEDNAKELWVKHKSYLLRTEEFGPVEDGEVAAAQQTSGSYIFKTKSGREYTWVAQLKEEHAQREAEYLARELSRVGLTESEWLRRMAK